MSEIQPMDVMVDASREALKVLSNSLRRAKAETITRPADPNAAKISDDDFLTDYQRWMDDDADFQSRDAQARMRWNVAPGKVPARLVEFAREGYRIQRRKEAEEFDRLVEGIGDGNAS